MNRRTFLAMGAAATAGLVRAQSLAVKKRIKNGDAIVLTLPDCAIAKVLAKHLAHQFHL